MISANSRYGVISSGPSGTVARPVLKPLQATTQSLKNAAADRSTPAMRRNLAPIIGDPYPGSRIVFFTYFGMAMICTRTFRVSWIGSRMVAE